MTGKTLKNTKQNQPTKKTKARKLSTAQIFFIIFSAILVLSMVLSLFVNV
jgi:predicted nucleic acid-binding Zn ribbon protein